MVRWLVGVSVLAWGSAAMADPAPLYGAAPAWVKPLPALAAPAAAPAGAPIQVLVADSQIHFGADGDEFYREFQAKVLTPDGLALGGLTAQWNPETDRLTIHRLRILRGDEVIDVLKTDKFTILRRENNLEQAMLDGRLTATLQVKGLQVGDILDFATTIVHRDPVTGGRSQAEGALPAMAVPGWFRIRAEWPKSKPLRWRATPDMVKPQVSETGDVSEIGFEAQNLDSVLTTDGAPARYNLRRTVEFSQFSDWREVSVLMAGLFEKAAVLPVASPLKAEVARIRAASSDPAVRAEMALKLVQDQIRYVFIGLDGGAYRPAAADETWTRRFGDCKAKTALLLALLKDLGIEAEPALVSTAVGDGLDQRLPRLSLFDHVLVRAHIGGEVYWLDGTRTGDSDIEMLTRPPSFFWALPVTSPGADLVRLDQSPPPLPATERLLKVDASAGLDAPVTVSVEEVDRGDSAMAFARVMAAAPRDDAQRALKKKWADELSWVEPDKVDWTWDEHAQLLTLTLEGSGKLDLSKGAKDPTTLWWEVDKGSFAKPDQYKRPKEQDATTPFAVDFPYSRRWTTTVKLPKSGDRQFSAAGADVDETFGGYSYQRTSSVVGDRFYSTRTVRALKPEITATEAAESETRRKTFNTGVLWLGFDWVKPADQRAVAVWKDPAKVSADELAALVGNKPFPMVQIGWMLLNEGHGAPTPEPAARRALEMFDKADAAGASTHLGRAHAFAALKQYRRAIAEYDAVIATQAAAAKNGLAMVVVGRGEAEAAARVSADRAEALAADGKPEAALQSLAEAIARDPKGTGPLYDRAQYNAAHGDAAGALADIEAAIKLAPEDAEYRRMRANLLVKAGRRDEAVRELDEAVRLEPDSGVNLLSRGRVLFGMGRNDKALLDLSEALRIEPFNTVSLRSRADVEVAMGRYEPAMQDLDLVVELKPDDPIPLNNRCWGRALAGKDFDKARADCDAALKIRPKSAETLDSRAFVGLRQERWAQARADYDAALALDPKHAHALYGRGVVRLRSGDKAGGEADIAAAKALDLSVTDRYAGYGVKL